MPEFEVDVPRVSRETLDHALTLWVVARNESGPRYTRNGLIKRPPDPEGVFCGIGAVSNRSSAWIWLVVETLRNATTIAIIRSIVLNGNDVMVLVRLAADPEPWTFRSLAADLAMDPAALHRAVARLKIAKLIDEEREVNRANLEEFLEHGVRFLLPAELGPSVRGVPTAWGVEPLRSRLATSDDPPPVWPDPNGVNRGPRIEPMSEGVLALGQADPRLGEWFALIDAIRVGRSRERKLAAEELSARIWGTEGS